LHPLPKVTVVTVCYNPGELLEPTLKSVLSQDYPNLEYIVIDGGSTDGSVELIKQYADKLSYWVSEPDKGIYDAMNKAAAKATGTYINFMNAGDWFLQPETVKQMMEKAPATADMIYGSHEVRYPNFVKKKRSLPLTDMWKYSVYSHQSLFARTEHLQQQPFSTDYPICADHQFNLRQLARGRQFYDTGMYVCSFGAGGVSDVRMLQSYRETYQLAKQHQQGAQVHLFHRWHLLKYKLIGQVRTLLPASAFEQLMQLKNTLLPRT
jgi:glycosyltransferase involved in cell wall biosynthesis